ncbi:MAG: TonB-dependent receptor [Odoribacteraceae bacterium]|jgi:TonB-linked SusC/RagA family outer membrane protein|nr:TonB-dependent receptor [Odoribacteraceae bacterium]
MYSKVFTKPVNALSLTTCVSRVFLVWAALSIPLSLTAQTTGEGSGQAQQKNISISGSVLDEDGLPLPGVAIRIKGTDKGTVTNANGEYTLVVPDQNAILVYSFVGFFTREVVVGSNRIKTVILKPDVRELEDVVVVGFSTQRRENVVSAITTIKPAELKGPSSNLTTLLGGKISGMISFQRSGEPGKDDAEFFIRGVGSFGTGKVDPLILIDGIESSTTDLARLQPDDIKDFSVLKDATASAVYGARGANGVILVNTKSGEQGATKFSFRFENSLSTNTRNFQLADNITYMELANEARLTRNPNSPLLYPNSKIAHTKAGDNPLLYPNNNWIDELIKPYTMNQRYNASLSGGGRVARFYIAGTYNVDHGVLKDDSRNNFKNNVSFKSYSIRSNTDINFTKTTWGSVRVYAQFRDYTGPIGGGGETFKSAISANPVAFPIVYPQSYSPSAKHPLFGSDLVAGTGNVLYVNPYAQMVSGYQQELQSTINAQMEFKQDFSFLTEGLRARAMGYIQRYSRSNSQRAYSPFYYYAVETMNGIYLNQWNHGSEGTVGTAGTDYLVYTLDEKSSAVNGVFYGEAAIDYDRAFGAHSVTGMLVGIIRHSVTGLATTLQASLPSRNLGLSGRFTYGYDSRYLLEMNFGYNGSERFSKQHRWGFFPSIGGGWIVSNEEFFAPAKEMINMFKLRASYGLIGNDQIGDPEDRFFYISTVDLNNAARGSQFGYDFGYSRNGVRTTNYENLEIGWEESRQLNLGLDLNVAGVNMVFEAYQQHRSSILLLRSNIPASMGLHTTVKANTGKARSRGLDLSVDYSKQFNKDWRTTLRGSFTFAQSRFTVYDEPRYDENEYYRSKVGYAFSQQWGYVADRLFIDDHEVANSPSQARGNYPISGGDIKYRDVNKDGVITRADMVPIGYPTTPEINFGFGGTIGYKNLDFSFYFTGLARESLFIEAASVAPFVADGGLQNGLLSRIANDHWSEDNRDLYAFWPRLSEGQNTNNTHLSTWWMHNGALLRLKSIELGYNLPRKNVSAMGLSDLRVYFSGSNLFAISKFKLWDPEMGGKGLGYPVQMVFNLGLSVSL